MRAIGQLPDETAARHFGAYLLVEGIPNQAEMDDDRQWTVWVHDDDHLEKATQLLTGYLASPKDRKYGDAVSKAEKILQQAESEQKAWSKRFKDRAKLTDDSVTRRARVTMVLIGLCVGVGLIKLALNENSLLRWLYISEYLNLGGVATALPEVRHGQVWRLFTPILLHFGFLHLFFNMLWMLDLGVAIESRLGSAKLIGMVAGIALVSNVGQYFLAGPLFGGMSGVVYGLFGYVWLRGKLDPDSGFYMEPLNVVLMLVWFVAGMSGYAGPIANMAHGAGLVMGVLWGVKDAQLSRR